MFNRTRERVLKGSGTYVCNQYYNSIYDHPTYPCSLPFEKKYSQSLSNKEKIRDVTPVGKFRPGDFKISDVERSKVTTTVGSIFADIYYANKSRCVMRRLQGSLLPSLSRLASLSLDYINPVVPDASRVSRVALKATAKLNSPDQNLAEAYSEAGQTLRMMVSPMKGLRDILKRVFITRKGFRRSADDAANAWLEYRYGWTPLYSLLKEMFAVPVVKDTIQVASANEFTKTSTATPFDWVRPTSQTPWCLLSSQEDVLEEVDRAAYYFRVIDSSLWAGMKRGTSVFSIPTFLWEKVPLSFAVDWWFNVGEWIAAMQPNPAVKILGFTYSYKKKTKSSVIVKASTFPFPWTGQGLIHAPCGACTSIEKEYYLRLVMSPPPIEHPNFDGMFNSVKHAIDALSLIYQRGALLQNLRRL